MCGESAFVLFFPKGHRHLDDVDLMEFTDEGVKLRDMSGNETSVPGRIRTIDFVNRRIELT